MHVQSKKAAEEAKLAKKQEESEAVRQAHREEARLKEGVTHRRLEAKVTPPHLISRYMMWTSEDVSLLRPQTRKPSLSRLW